MDAHRGEMSSIPSNTTIGNTPLQWGTIAEGGSLSTNDILEAGQALVNLLSQTSFTKEEFQQIQGLVTALQTSKNSSTLPEDFRTNLQNLLENPQLQSILNLPQPSSGSINNPEDIRANLLPVLNALQQSIGSPQDLIMYNFIGRSDDHFATTLNGLKDALSLSDDTVNQITSLMGILKGVPSQIPPNDTTTMQNVANQLNTNLYNFTHSTDGSPSQFDQLKDKISQLNGLSPKPQGLIDQLNSVVSTVNQLQSQQLGVAPQIPPLSTDEARAAGDATKTAGFWRLGTGSDNKALKTANDLISSLNNASQYATSLSETQKNDLKFEMNNYNQFVQIASSVLSNVNNAYLGAARKS